MSKQASNGAVIEELKARFGGDLFAANLRESDIMDAYATLAPESKAAKEWEKRRTIARAKVNSISEIITASA